MTDPMDADHDKITRLIVEHEQLSQRVANLEEELKATSKIVTGWRGGIAVMVAVGGLLGWIISHLGDLVRALSRGAAS